MFLRNNRHQMIIGLAAALASALPAAAAGRILNDDGTVATARPPIHWLIRPNGSVPTGTMPSQMVKAYGIDQLSNQGAGTTIAIVDAFDDPNIEADLGVFTAQFGLPACTTANGCFQKLYASGSQPTLDAGWALEISLDVEWAHVIAPQAKILLVEAASNSFTDLLTAVDVAVAHGANVVSMSFGGGEFSTETSQDSHFAVPGVAFVASSGDSGHGVEYPAASPSIVGVGGTTLSIESDGTYISESAWSGSGGGTSRYEAGPDYQAGVASRRAKRMVPDVAMDANPSSGVPVYDSIPYQGLVNWTQVGGTSLAAPMIASVIALADSTRIAGGKSSLSSLDFLTPVYSSLFTNLNDIASGQNGGCPKACKSVPGYDQVTGLGTPIANMLVPALVALP